MANLNDLLIYLKGCLVQQEDGAHVSTDSGIMALAVRRDADTAFAADGDYTPLATDDKGFLKVSIEASTVTLAVNLDLADDEVMAGYTPDGGTTRVLMKGDATDGLLVNLGTNNDVDTELPAAAALTDNTATPTVPAVGAFGMGYDGTNWDMLRAGVTGTQAAATGMANNLGYGQFLSSAPTITDTQLHSFQMDNRGALKVIPAFAGAVAVGLVTNADGAATSSLATSQAVVARETAFNGTTFDRVRTIEGASTDTGKLAVAESPSASANAAAPLSTSSALEDDRVVKATAGNLFSVQGFSTAAQFVQVHNLAAAPADGVVPVLSFAVEANKNFYKEFPVPVNFSTGIYVCNSSTQATKSIGAATCWFEVQYK